MGFFLFFQLNALSRIQRGGQKEHKVKVTLLHHYSVLLCKMFKMFIIFKEEIFLDNTASKIQQNPSQNQPKLKKLQQNLSQKKNNETKKAIKRREEENFKYTNMF